MFENISEKSISRHH